MAALVPLADSSHRDTHTVDLLDGANSPRANFVVRKQHDTGLNFSQSCVARGAAATGKWVTRQQPAVLFADIVADPLVPIRAG